MPAASGQLLCWTIQGEDKGNGTPLALLRFHPDLAAVPLGQFVAEEEAYSRTLKD